VGAGLVVLVGFTASAVASVSVWWVPAYLALMVLIFVTPRERRPWARVSKASVESIAAGTGDLSRGLQVDCTDGMNQHHPAAEPDSGSAVNELTEPSGSSPESAGSVTIKPRRGQVRTRKAARTAVEPMPDSPPVTWIRVGPGKFVRVEGSIPAVDQAQTDKVAVGTSPATDVPVHAPAPAPAEALVVQDPPSPLAAISGDMGVVVGSDDSVLGSVTEEYGIAPTAFGPAPGVTSLVEGLAHDVSGVDASPEPDPGFMAGLGGKMPRHDLNQGRFWSHRRTCKGRADWVSPGIANARLGWNQASWRRKVQPGPKTRTLVRARFAPDARQRQAARRAFGRIAHVKRTLRPRSPPYRLGFHEGPALPAGTCRGVARGGVRPVEPARCG